MPNKPIESKYTFRKSPFFEGIVELMKDGEVTVCHKAPIGVIPHPALDNQALLLRPACNKNCPLFATAMIRQRGSDKDEPGYVIQCVERPYAIFVDETSLNKMEILH